MTNHFVQLVEDDLDLQKRVCLLFQIDNTNPKGIIAMALGDKAQTGLEGVVVAETSLSKVDGEKGELIYRGYNIDELASCSFEEICCLFLNGDLPTRQELKTMDDQLKRERAIPKEVEKFIASTPISDHPMAMLRTSVSMLSGHMSNIEEQDDSSLRNNAIALISKMGTIVAEICRVRGSAKKVDPANNLSHAANCLFMARGEEPNGIIAKTLDTSLVLHADHGFNASTFTARAVTSSLSDMVSAVTAAIGSLKGPLHGGANSAVMKMLIEIGSVERVDSWLQKALDEKQKIMGFGHRVYKVMDPRAKHLKRMSKEWGERVGETKWFSISDKIEKLMLEKKNLNPNVDFYSASTYYAMGFQPEMYTLLFAMSRVVGWVAHVIEQLDGNRLIRPKSAYVGPLGKVYRPIEQR